MGNHCQSVSNTQPTDTQTDRLTAIPHTAAEETYSHVLSAEELDKGLEEDLPDEDIREFSPKLQYIVPKSNDDSVMRSARNMAINVGQLGTGHNRVGERYGFYDVEDIRPILGDEELDKVLSITTANLRPHSQLVMMWGCAHCWMRGTETCPHEIPEKGRHANHYCDYAIKFHLFQLKAMRSPTGLKYQRNLNMMILQDMYNYYTAKLNRLKEADRLTKTEMTLVKYVAKLGQDLGNRYDTAIKQDEGVKHISERVLTPKDLNEMLSKARMQKEKVVDAEVVVDEVKDDADEGR